MPYFSLPQQLVLTTRALPTKTVLFGSFLILDLFVDHLLLSSPTGQVVTDIQWTLTEPLETILLKQTFPLSNGLGKIEIQFFSPTTRFFIHISIDPYSNTLKYFFHGQKNPYPLFKINNEPLVSNSNVYLKEHSVHQIPTNLFPLSTHPIEILYLGINKEPLWEKICLRKNPHELAPYIFLWGQNQDHVSTLMAPNQIATNLKNLFLNYHEIGIPSTNMTDLSSGIFYQSMRACLIVEEENFIHILPSLPTSWNAGQVHLRLKNNSSLYLRWTKHRLLYARLEAAQTNSQKILIGNAKAFRMNKRSFFNCNETLLLEKGKTYLLDQIQ